MATINGVDQQALEETIQTFRNEPERARFEFRSKTTWEGGAYSTSSMREFTMAGDEPTILLGSNRAANAVEQVLAALGACLSVGIAYNAAARGIALEAVTIAINGSLDLRGFLGISDHVRPGFESINVRCTITSSAPPATLEGLLSHVEATSPVTDILRRPVPVAIGLIVAHDPLVNEAVLPSS